VAEPLYVYALLDQRVAPPTPGVRLGSDRGQTGVRLGSDRGQTGVRPGSDPRFRRLEVIEVGGIFAAVERRAEPPAISEQTLRDQHQIVVRLARTASAILPVRFGTFVERQELERVVEARREVLNQALRDVRGKVQMTVRVFGPSPRTPSTPVPTTGTAYLRARASLSKPRLPTIAQAIVNAVRPFVSAQTIDTGRGHLRVSINHLVDRKVVAKYLSAVEPLIGSVPEPTISAPRSTAVVSGPWPPFAFVPDLLSEAMPLERLTP
jgi:hypothetical protein